MESWSEVLRDLRDRGMPAPRLVMGDGHLGIWGGAAQHLAGGGRATVLERGPHEVRVTSWGIPEILNVLEQLPRGQHGVAKVKLGAVAYALTRAEAERKRQEFEAWCQQHGYEKAAQTLGRDWDRMVTFYRYPQEHWRHLRTVNVVESPLPRCGYGRTRPNGSRGWSGPRR